jgi:hypothetical protein
MSQRLICRAPVIGLADGAAGVAAHASSPAGGIVSGRCRSDFSQEFGAWRANEVVAVEAETAGEGTPMPTMPDNRGARRRVHVGAPRLWCEPWRGRGRDPNRGWCSRARTAPTARHLAEGLGDG